MHAHGSVIDKFLLYFIKSTIVFISVVKMLANFPCAHLDTLLTVYCLFELGLAQCGNH